MRLWHMLIITAIVIPVILYFNFNPNPVATVAIAVALAGGYIVFRVSHYRHLFPWLRNRDPGTAAAWVQAPTEEADSPGKAPSYPYGSNNDRVG